MFSIRTGLDFRVSIVAGFIDLSLFVATAKWWGRFDAPKLGIAAVVGTEISLIAEAVVGQVKDLVGQLEAGVQGAIQAIIQDGRFSGNATEYRVA